MVVTRAMTLVRKKRRLVPPIFQLAESTLEIAKAMILIIMIVIIAIIAITATIIAMVMVMVSKSKSTLKP